MAQQGSYKYMSRLKHARVLIIGGTSGIGFGIAEALLEHEASVIVSSSSQDRVSGAVRRLEAQYPSAKGRVEGYACNLGSAESMTAEIAMLFSKVADGGKLDHVIHTAGDVLAIGELERFSLQEIQQAGMVRFFSPLMVAQQLRQHLKPGPTTSYIMTTGGASERPQTGWAVVMSYLTGLQGMCVALAKDLAPIRVNLVGLGPVETEFWDGLKQSGQFSEIESGFLEKMATGSLGSVEDVVESYLYLMKDKNATGSMVYTNGGMLFM